MNRTAEGVFDTYAAAGKVVRELELWGISGEQVEVVSHAGHDVSLEGVPQPQNQDAASSGDKYTLVIVRPLDDKTMEQAKDLMDRYGAKLFLWHISAHGAPTARTTSGNTSGTETTGNALEDLPGCGGKFSVRGEGSPQSRCKGHN
ncbi:MAG TPA: hypothetical protein VMB47_08215 [Candidatus Aquilonibacter sp.]|nr:hypothetical protein [Candidatus Aquilonibacter sp.]